MATFDSIPGVPELREIRQEWQQYNREFNAAFGRGDGRFPAVPQVKESDVASKYPSAVFALQVEYELGARISSCMALQKMHTMLSVKESRGKK